MFETTECLAAFRSGRMALLIGSLQEPRQFNDSKVDKIEQGEAFPRSK